MINDRTPALVGDRGSEKFLAEQVQSIKTPENLQPRHLYRADRMTWQLRSEHDAALEIVCRLPQVERRAFWNLIGRPGERLDVGGVGLIPIQIDYRSGLYEPAEAGIRAIIIPIKDRPNRDRAQLLDLAAWLPGSNEIFLRQGNAAALGEWWLGPLPPSAMRVFSTPAGWCKSNAAGMMLVDWSKAWQMLNTFDTLIADSLELARRLKRSVRPPRIPVPNIYVDETVAGL